MKENAETHGNRKLAKMPLLPILGVCEKLDRYIYIICGSKTKRGLDKLITVDQGSIVDTVS